MEGEVNKINTRNCEWCASAVSSQAFKCPQCKKWRKDIDKERIQCYVWYGLSFFPALLFYVGMNNLWWEGRSQTSILGFPVFQHTAFSIKAFLASASGWFILAGFIITGLMGTRYYISVSKKIGAWWWY